MYRKFDIRDYYYPQKLQKGGKVVSEIWKDKTGLDWSEAKKRGLTEEREIESVEFIVPKNQDIRYFNRGVKENNNVKGKSYDVYDNSSKKYHHFDEKGNYKGQYSKPSSDSQMSFNRDVSRGLEKIVYANKKNYSDQDIRDIRSYFGMNPSGGMTPELEEKVDMWKRKRKIDDWSTNVKKYIPFKPVGQMIFHFSGKGKFENSFSVDENQALYDAIQNAMIRNKGAKKGGTEYEDFDSNNFDKSLTNLVNKGKGDAVGELFAKLALGDPTTNMKMSVGRGNYYVDEHGNAYYTDIYDFNPTKQVNFKEDNPYTRLRALAGKKEKKPTGQSGEWDDSRIIIKLPYDKYGKEAKKARMDRERYNDRFLYTP